MLQLFLFFMMCLQFKPTLRWVIFTALIPTLSLVQPGSYESGDFVTHIVRIMDMYSSLQHGIFPVRWAWLLQGGYGYPLFSFMTVLPYYVICAIHVVGISFVASTKIYLAAIYVGSAVSMWFCARAVFNSNVYKEKIAALSAICYVFAPYTLINLEFRAALGELTGFALFPLLVYAVLENKRFVFVITLAILLISHPGITLLGAPLICLLMIIKKRWAMMVSVVASIGLSAFYLLPALFEAKFSGQVAYGSTLWTESTIPGFQPILWLLWSPWRWGFLFQGHYGEVANVIGAAYVGAVLVIFISILKRWMKPFETHIFLALFCMMSIGMFMMLPYSRPLWNALPLIRHLQFPSRIMFYVVFPTSLMLGYVLTHLRLKPIIWKLTLFVCLGWTVLNWSHRTFLPAIDDAHIYQSLPHASFEHERLPEAMPIVEEQPMKARESAFVVNKNDAIVTTIKTLPTQRVYKVSTNSTMLFQENTLYFPGWVARIDGKQTTLQRTKKGVMVVRVPSGEHTLEFTFEDTPIRTVANTLSLITWGAVGFYVLFKRKA